MVQHIKNKPLLENKGDPVSHSQQQMKTQTPLAISPLNITTVRCKMLPPFILHEIFSR